MHRIDTSTATPDNRFTEGDPAIPVAATVVSASWLNAVQEELAAVITGAGLELDKADNAQLRQAISQAITVAKPGLASKSAPGLVQIGDGLAVTPQGLLSVLLASVSQAGIVQLAATLSDSMTQAPTCNAVKAAIESRLAAVNVPVGGIIAFSGTFGGAGSRFPVPLDGAEPDTSWCLCDGTSTNGLPVPDLRGRMIMGASDAYAAGSTGGTAAHTHALSGSVGATTLSAAQLASHTHPAAASYLIYASGDVPVAGGNYRYTASAAPAAGGSQSHTHTISGASGQASSLPPYYALAYIMRVA